MNFWTPEKERRLVRLVGQGFSAAMIGEALGCSRNAVLGKIHRGKGRLGELSSPVAKRARRAEAVTRRAARKTSVAGAVVKAKAAPNREAPSAPPAPRIPAPSTPPIGFAAATVLGGCLWFAGDPKSAGGPDMPVCGAPRADFPGTRWCPHHLERARGA